MIVNTGREGGRDSTKRDLKRSKMIVREIANGKLAHHCKGLP